MICYPILKPSYFLYLQNNLIAKRLNKVGEKSGNYLFLKFSISWFEFISKITLNLKQL